MDDQEIKRVLEALVFASEKPLLVNEIKDVMAEVDSRKIRDLLEELKTEYQNRDNSFKLVEVAGGFQFCTDPSYSAWLKKLYKARHAERLTGPSMETLAIIAYKQPMTRAEIEALRGVNVDGVIKTLLDRKLIRIMGRREVIGRPIIYGTTSQFLEYFGLNDLSQLPKLEEFSAEALEELKTGEGNEQSQEPAQEN